jgi:hypothetical protein
MNICRISLIDFTGETTMLDLKGTITKVWQGKNGTFWATVDYWIGTGWQSVTKQIPENVYYSVKEGLWNL